MRGLKVKDVGSLTDGLLQSTCPSFTNATLFFGPFLDWPGVQFSQIVARWHWPKHHAELYSGSAETYGSLHKDYISIL